MFLFRHKFLHCCTKCGNIWAPFPLFASFAIPSRNLCQGVKIKKDDETLTGGNRNDANKKPKDGEIEREEREFTKLRLAYGLTSILSRPERLFLVHPRLRGVALKHTSVLQQVEEAVTLCESIPGFSVISNLVVSTEEHSVRKKLIWNSGRLEKLREALSQHPASAIFINVDMLNPLQQHELSIFFGVPVYDRYTVVLNIFKLYARTREARLQIALAEIPYIRARLKFTALSGKRPAKNVLEPDPLPTLGSDEGTHRMEVLRLREHALRAKLCTTVDKRTHEVEAMRAAFSAASASKMVLIGVIGYTNAGKTSLIKALTDEQSLCGEDRLFATLDTTTHQAILPSRQKILLADTIGFISNLPIQLFASFSATLQHVERADLLIHVMDLSHPDVLAQRDQVMDTLKGLKMRHCMRNGGVIMVGNKLDKCTPKRLHWLHKKALLPPEEMSEESNVDDDDDPSSSLFSLPISCRTLEGLPRLIQQMDGAVRRITGSRLRRFRLPHASSAIEYLYAEGLVPAEGPTLSACGNFQIFDIAMTDAQLARFQAAVGKNKLKRKMAEGEAENKE